MNHLQQEIITSMDTVPQINPEQEFIDRSTFLARKLSETGLHGFVLGISGGQDSLLAGLIAKHATDIINEAGGAAQFHAVLLPYQDQKDRQDALAAVAIIHPDVTHDVNIAPFTDSFVESFHKATGEAMTDFNKGNVKARMRMIAQYAIGGHYGLLTVGTDHAAEAVTGFYTKYGDGACDITPLSGLTKRQGRQMLEYLEVPKVFTEKAPTADLLDVTPTQPDEIELGLSYQTIDDYLEGKPVADEVAHAIELRYRQTAHKRTMPIAYTRK